MRSTSQLKLFGLALLVLLASLACGLTARRDRAAQPPAAGANSGAPTGTINITAEDLDFTLSATQAPAGVVTFVVRNEGHAPHNFSISGNGVDASTELLDTGESQTLQVTLTPGTYDYVCTVPGHAMLGMRGTLTVTP